MMLAEDIRQRVKAAIVTMPWPRGDGVLVEGQHVLTAVPCMPPGPDFTLYFRTAKGATIWFDPIYFQKDGLAVLRPVLQEGFEKEATAFRNWSDATVPLQVATDVPDGTIVYIVDHDGDTIQGLYMGSRRPNVLPLRQPSWFGCPVVTIAGALVGVLCQKTEMGTSIYCARPRGVVRDGIVKAEVARNG